MSLAAVLRDARAVENVLRARPFALPAARIAALTRIEPRRLRRLLAGLVAAEIVVSTPGLPGDDGRERGRRYYVPHPDSRTDPSATA